MEKAKIRLLATPKPLNRSSQKLAGVITSWTVPGMQNFVSIGAGVSVPQIRDFAVLLGWLVAYVRFLGSSIRLQPTPLYGYLRKIYVKWRRSEQGSAFWGSLWLYFIFGPLNFLKTAISGTDFDWTVFLQPKTALTWRCSNMNYP